MKKNFNQLDSIKPPGGHYVYQEKEEIYQKLLRALEETARENSLIENENKFSSIVTFFSGNFSSATHSILASTYIQLQIALQKKDSISLPEWIELLLKEAGIRKISKQYLTQANIQLSSLGLTNFESICRSQITSPAIAYSFSQYDLAQNLLLQQNNENKLLLTRIQIHKQEDFDIHAIQNTLKTCLSHEEEGLVVLGYLMLKLFRSNNYNYKLIKKQIEIDLDCILLSRTPLHLKVQLLNALNYIYMKENKVKVEEVFTQIEKLILSDNSLIKDQLLSNLFYQKSISAGLNGLSNLELKYLKKAYNHEPGFFDISYRIASALHDENSDEAILYYQAAIENGPIFNAIINDYGICLKEQGYTHDFSRLEKFLIKTNIELEWAS